MSPKETDPVVPVHFPAACITVATPPISIACLGTRDYIANLGNLGRVGLNIAVENC